MFQDAFYQILPKAALRYIADTSYDWIKEGIPQDTVLNPLEEPVPFTIKEETIVPVRTGGSTSVKDINEYLVVDTKNDVVSLANYVEGRVSQNTPPGYPDMCLSFAYYHAYKLYNGDPLSSMTAVEGEKYHYASFFYGVKNDSKKFWIYNFSSKS